MENTTTFYQYFIQSSSTYLLIKAESTESANKVAGAIDCRSKVALGCCKMVIIDGVRFTDAQLDDMKTNTRIIQNNRKLIKACKDLENIVDDTNIADINVELASIGTQIIQWTEQIEYAKNAISSIRDEYVLHNRELLEDCCESC